VELLRFSEIREPAALETVPRVKAKYDERGESGGTFNAQGIIW